jgi:histidinol-phosphate aminotransferase
MTGKIKPQRGLETLKPHQPGRSVAEIQRQFGVTNAIKLASNENPLGPSPKAVAAIQQLCAGVHIYPDGMSTALREALADRLDVAPNQVAVGNGADGLILETCMAFLDETSEVVVSRSSFPVYDIYTKAMRARLVKTPLKDFGLDLTAMARAINEHTRLVFVCNPNNPTGSVVHQDELVAFLADVPENVLVVIDEAYFEYVDDPHFPNSLALVRAGKENVLVYHTFSKVYGLAGLRLGYALGPPEVVSALTRIKEPFSVNVLSQAAGLAALEDDDFLHRTLELNRAGKEFFYQEFGRLGLFFVRSQANFVLVRLGPHGPEIVTRLMEKGVIIRPGSGYELPEFARITTGTLEQNERLVRTLAETLQEF